MGAHSRGSPSAGRQSGRRARILLRDDPCRIHLGRPTARRRARRRAAGPARRATRRWPAGALSSERERGAIIDRKTQQRTGLRSGDTFACPDVFRTPRTSSTTLPSPAITDDRQYSLRPTVFVPILTWDRIRPGTLVDVDSRDVNVNFLAVNDRPDCGYRRREESDTATTSGVEVSDRKTAWEATPGYKEQQST